MLLPLREGTPARIGPYELLARLGAGGMGEVFLGRTPSVAGAHDGTYVAVKTVRRDVVAEPAFRDRFRREIKVARLVSSPYAAAPLGGDADDEVPWLATAYVPGPSLSQAVRRGGPLPVPTVRALGTALARALADLHGAGVLHRDLKPGNVMLAADGPRVIDFGIARSSGATTMTATGMMVGTPSFMSPEHVAGARHVTGASDVFCLGSVLCYAATGEDPFGDGPLAAVLYRVSQAEADLSRVPSDLRDVIAACLAADPAARPTPEGLVALLGGGERASWPQGVLDHIGEYGRELAQLVATGTALREVASAPTAPDQLPTLPPGAPTSGPAPAPRKRRRLLAAGVALALVAGGVGAYVLWPEGKQPAADAKPPKTAGPRIPGVDDRGLTDASGVVPQNTEQRPAGWKPWKEKLTAPALGCSAGESVLVCRTTDGRYEALDTATGRKLWDANLVKDPRDNLSFVGPSGGIFIAGATARPSVHGDTAVLATGERLQVRDARTGAVRWEKRAAAQQGQGSRPIVADGIVFAATPRTEELDLEEIGMTAFSLADGKELWSKGLTNAGIPRSEIKDFEPVAYAKGVVYALGDAGIIAYDGKTGTELGQVDQEAEDCETVKVLGPDAYCLGTPHSGAAEGRLHRLDSRTLAAKGSLPAPVEGLRPDAVGLGAAVGLGPDAVKIHALKDGALLGSYATKAAPEGLALARSAPLLAGEQVVWADYSALYTVRLDKHGKPAGLKVTPVPGAPGPRAEKEPDPNGTSFADMIRSPEVLLIGGIAHLVYDQGVVASVELPK
ncbi:PQQ-binding-like beta-propeller repeat protein [Streptomyces sp. HUAS MG47]|uniref:protein kinase domain-containing protein n=1 Tax=Streptomyces solicamelliae TaxID=3231716 RepID=UPI003877E27E